ncbi:MAG: hypothetical protein J7L45_01195 [Candidatus Aenigmarchaeota archaeon]|nr:hypothetical protein [Candidatus Aenigmarchaeota archaeon]
MKMAENFSTYGLWTSVIGALLILINGIAVLVNNTLYGWSATGVTATGWIEIILSVIMLIAVYFYKQNPKGVGWAIVILAIITLPFDGGFWFIGSVIAIIGGALIAYQK